VELSSISFDVHVEILSAERQHHVAIATPVVLTLCGTSYVFLMVHKRAMTLQYVRSFRHVFLIAVLYLAIKIDLLVTIYPY
jgi:hypothetical protein